MTSRKKSSYIKATEFLIQIKAILGKSLEHEALWIFQQVLGKNDISDLSLNQTQIRRIEAIVEKRLGGKPLQLLLGQYPFRKINLKTQRGVFIPRMETEMMIDLIPNDLPSNIILDLCCGSGPIGLSIKKEKEDLVVILLDISKKAIKLAQRNARMNNISIDIIRGNGLSCFKDNSFSAILCNPPYIPISDKCNLPDEVRYYDPNLSLFSGKDGLDFIKTIATISFTKLKNKGFLCYEHGDNQAEKCRNILNMNGFIQITSYKDMAERDRFTSCRKP
ncbi:MAG: peptide chain release factor N(5)-glutamine methyltransferase [Candidatus Coatesbacteria bacterium]|nr:peptide chain release factor N(5)-glutamine methyltransferase [Candidatus Coatesbacteria bacterium]